MDSTYEGDFRDPHAVESAVLRAHIRCRALGRQNPQCWTALEQASLMKQANMCFYDWQPHCRERLAGKLDLHLACSRDHYQGTEFEKAMCPALEETGDYCQSHPEVVTERWGYRAIVSLLILALFLSMILRK